MDSTSRPSLFQRYMNGSLVLQIIIGIVCGVDWHPNRSTHLRRNGSTLNRHFRPQTGGLFLAFFSSSSLIFVLT